jgi:hypothetical protein
MYRTKIAITWIFLCSLFVGCYNIDLNEKLGTKAGVSGVLDVLYMHEKMGTKRIDLSQNAKCPGTKVLNAINVETRVDKQVLLEAQGEFYIIPRTLADSVATYINKKFVESGLAVDKEKGRIINVSIAEGKLEATHICRGSIELKIEIPEINYSSVYEGIESSPDCSNALSYAIHLAVMDFLQDPVFQKYIKCNDVSK